MDNQSKQKQGKQLPNEQEILKALSELETSGVSVDEFCQMYSIDESTFKSLNRKHNKMKNSEKVGLLEVSDPGSVQAVPQVLFEVETIEGNVFRFYRESSPEFIKQLIG